MGSNLKPILSLEEVCKWMGIEIVLGGFTCGSGLELYCVRECVSLPSVLQKVYFLVSGKSDHRWCGNWCRKVSKLNMK